MAPFRPATISAQVDRGEQVADGGSEEEEEQGVDADAAAAAEGAKPKEAKVRKYQLYVDGIREHMTPAQLAEVFAPYGENLDTTVPVIKKYRYSVVDPCSVGSA